jgi:hypothetical protein
MDTTTPIVKPANGRFAPSSIGAPALSTSSPAAPIPMARPRPHVDPHSLAHTKKLSKPARAVLAAEILDGRLPLINPTIAMVAAVVGVSAAYIAQARRLTPEQRRDVVRGTRSLAAHKATNGA